MLRLQLPGNTAITSSMKLQISAICRSCDPPPAAGAPYGRDSRHRPTAKPLGTRRHAREVQARGGPASGRSERPADGRPGDGAGDDGAARPVPIAPRTPDPSPPDDRLDQDPDHIRTSPHPRALRSAVFPGQRGRSRCTTRRRRTCSQPRRPRLVTPSRQDIPVCTRSRVRERHAYSLPRRTPGASIPHSARASARSPRAALPEARATPETTCSVQRVAPSSVRLRSPPTTEVAECIRPDEPSPKSALGQHWSWQS